MRCRSLIFVLPALALPVLVALTPTATRAADDGAKVVEAAWQKAIEANDLDAVMACYAADAVAWFPDMPEAKGTKAIREAWQEFLDMYTVQKATYLDSHTKTVGDASVGWGTFSMTLLAKEGGDPITDTGRYTEVVERRNGRWVYVVDHASFDPIPDEEVDE